MTTSLLTLSLKSKRDLLRARQLARQAADLLGFDSADQLCLAAAVFDLACQAQALTGRAVASFQIAGGYLQIVCAPKPKRRLRHGLDDPPAFRISKSLPADAPVSPDDVTWMLRQFAEMAPLDLFAEMRKVNQELLATQLELARLRTAPAKHAASNVA